MSKVSSIQRIFATEAQNLVSFALRPVVGILLLFCFVLLLVWVLFFFFEKQSCQKLEMH